MRNNNSLAKSGSLELSISDCERIEDEFTKKAVTFSNFFTNNQMKAEAAKKVISRLDPLNKIKLVYDEGEKPKEPVKKPSRIKRTLISSIITTGLLGAAYLGALTYFGKQTYEAEIQGLTAENRFVQIQKQNSEKNNLLQQENITQLQENYSEALRTISEVNSDYSRSLEDRAKLQEDYQQNTLENQRLENAQEGLRAELKNQNQSYIVLGQVLKETRQKNTGLLAHLNQQYRLQAELLIEELMVQRTKVHGSYRCKGPFNNFVSEYAEFFFGREPSDQEKILLDSLLKKYVLTDGKSVEETIAPWTGSNTIILQYKKKLQVIDP